MPELRDIDTADYILRHHPATTASIPATSADLQGVGAALFAHREGSSVKPDSVSSHLFGFRCAGAQTRRLDKPKGFPGKVGRPGMSFFVPAGEQSKWECEGQHKLAIVFLGSQFLAQLATEAFDIDGASLQFHDAAFHFDEDGTRLGRMVEHRLRGNEPILSLEVDAWAQLIGLHVLRRYSSIARHASHAQIGLAPSELETAIEYMQANLSSPMRLAEIAASVGMPQFVFARAFRNSTGTTPHKYLTILRIEQAQVLLASGTLSLSDIACAVGFADQSHLTTQFRKALGTTPARYRRDYRG